MRIGVIQNRRSHRNRHGLIAIAAEGALHAAPETPETLAATLRDFAGAGIELLVIDGGDGTVRDVLTLAPGVFGGAMPLLAVVPRGKTNALARDLGLPRHWPIEAAIDTARTAPARRRRRPLLQVERPAEPILAGFIFGTGAFVGATRLAQHTHKAGLFNSLSVGASLAGFLVKTLAGGRNGAAAGEPIRLGIDGAEPIARQRFLVLASTLEGLPLKLKPFGPPQIGLKVLDVDAPPRRLLRSLPLVLAGRATPRLEDAGYRRLQGREIVLEGLSEFVLDGEILPARSVTLREGPVVEFVTA